MNEAERVAALWQIEEEKAREGFLNIAGVDEAGRGPLAGPVCAAAVILPAGFYLEGINDSKKLTEKKRDKLFDEIIRGAVSYGIAMAAPGEIDEHNILNATFLAMRRAVAALSPAPDFVLIDGNRMRGLDIPHACVVGGDARSISIAAASILAKVTRDRHMAGLHEAHPQYGFAVHKGYPTKAHYEALRVFGPSAVHRMSFNLKLQS